MFVHTGQMAELIRMSFCDCGCLHWCHSCVRWGLKSPWQTWGKQEVLIF